MFMIPSRPHRLMVSWCILMAGVALSALAPRAARAWEQRNDVSFLRGPYNEAFYLRHNESHRSGCAMHFFHTKQHNLLQRTPRAEHARFDQLLNDQSVAVLCDPPGPRTTPTWTRTCRCGSRTLS